MSELVPTERRSIPWGYCPECGSVEIRYAEGGHKQCACCHQEWFAGVDYTDVVRHNLGKKFQMANDAYAKVAAALSIEPAASKSQQKRFDAMRAADEPPAKPVRIHGLCDKHMHIGHFPPNTVSLPLPTTEVVCPWCERSSATKEP